MLARVVESLHQIAPTMASQRKPSEAAVTGEVADDSDVEFREISCSSHGYSSRRTRALRVARSTTVRLTIDARTNPRIAHIARNLY